MVSGTAVLYIRVYLHSLQVRCDQCLKRMSNDAHENRVRQLYQMHSNYTSYQLYDSSRAQVISFLCVLFKLIKWKCIWNWYAWRSVAYYCVTCIDRRVAFFCVATIMRIRHSSSATQRPCIIGRQQSPPSKTTRSDWDRIGAVDLLHPLYVHAQFRTSEIKKRRLLLRRIRYNAVNEDFVVWWLNNAWNWCLR